MKPLPVLVRFGKGFIAFLIRFGKSLVAFLLSGISIFLGIGLAVTSFELALAIQMKLILLLPCLLAAACVPVFLVVIPRYIYWWSYDFPIAPHRHPSAWLRRIRKSLPV